MRPVMQYSIHHAIVYFYVQRLILISYPLYVLLFDCIECRYHICKIISVPIKYLKKMPINPICCLYFCLIHTGIYPKANVIHAVKSTLSDISECHFCQIFSSCQLFLCDSLLECS